MVRFAMFSPLILFILLHGQLCIATSPQIITEGEEHIPANNPKCEKITIEMCTGIQYNMTIYPNLLKHAKQEEAEMDIKQYEMLVRVQCSPDFKFFICSLFAPVCTILNDPLPPCRHLCQSAKIGCETLMRKFGYQWPEIFDCEKMPRSQDGMCVGEQPKEEEEVTTDAPAMEEKQPLECPPAMKVLSTTRHSLLIANQTLEQCSLPCQNDALLPTFFTAQTRHYLRLWTGAGAVTCLVCCAFTIISFLIDLDRFEFPERAILYMAVCYAMVSGTYIVGLFVENGLSCAVLSATKHSVVTQGNENIWCSTLAFSHFFFSSAGAIWWLALCFAWFLVTTLKWGEAPVGEVFSTYFNAMAWITPGIGGIALILFGTVDGDIFTGICSVGNLQPKLFLRMVVLPQAIVIGLGFMLFVCGFISILRIRSYIKGNRFIANKFEHAEASEKLSRLVIRISCFSLIYTLPMVVSLYCALYQTQNMEQWLTNWYSTRCLHALRSSLGFTQPREHCPIGDGVEMHNQPDTLPFFLKYLSYFTVGIACAVWTLNGKTVNSYGDFFNRIFRRGDHQRGRPTRVPTRVH